MALAPPGSGHPSLHFFHGSPWCSPHHVSGTASKLHSFTVFASYPGVCDHGWLGGIAPNGLKMLKVVFSPHFLSTRNDPWAPSLSPPGTAVPWDSFSPEQRLPQTELKPSSFAHIYHKIYIYMYI